VKSVALILAVYIGILSFVPCYDGFHDCDDHQNTEMTHDHDDTSHDHQSNDGCTPFCVCSCCGTVVVLSEMREVDYFVLAPVTINQIDYTTMAEHPFLPGVWHPPTLG